MIDIIDLLCIVSICVSGYLLFTVVACQLIRVKAWFRHKKKYRKLRDEALSVYIGKK